MSTLVLVRHCESSGPEPDAPLTGGRRLPCAISPGQLIGFVLQSIDPGFDFQCCESLSGPDVHLIDAGRRLRFERVWRAGEV